LLGEPALVAMLGTASARHLYALAHNRDPRPVEVGRRRRSMGAQRALGWRTKTFDEIDGYLMGLVDKLTRRLRGAHRVCRTVILRMRFEDFERVTRSHTLPDATCDTGPILDTARRLLRASAPMIRDRGLTLVGVTLTNLDDDKAIQLTLPLDRRQPAALDGALDRVRDRFGSSAITRGVLVGRGEGLSVPLLPD
ncbi:MAG TPA: DNA polymerase IV, partial [Nocardioidaceae bacterium]|nr:DNA polymerase IV [Nocardioidaceae bacterium]